MFNLFVVYLFVCLFVCCFTNHYLLIVCYQQCIKEKRILYIYIYIYCFSSASTFFQSICDIVILVNYNVLF